MCTYVVQVQPQILFFFRNTCFNKYQIKKKHVKKRTPIFCSFPRHVRSISSLLGGTFASNCSARRSNDKFFFQIALVPWYLDNKCHSPSSADAGRETDLSRPPHLRDTPCSSWGKETQTSCTAFSIFHLFFYTQESKRSKKRGKKSDGPIETKKYFFTFSFSKKIQTKSFPPLYQHSSLLFFLIGSLSGWCWPKWSQERGCGSSPAGRTPQ